MTAIDPRPLDILAGDFYVNDPYSRYAWLRENDPIHWDEINQIWVITRYDDIVEIEKNKAAFINGGQETGYRPNIAADPSIIGLDDPIHTARRMLVARRFTPKAVSKWEDHVRDVVVNLLDSALEHGDDVEVIDDVASPLPAMMIGLLLGFPDEMWSQLRDWSERTIQLGGGPRYFDDDGVLGAMEFAGACADLYE